MQTRDVEMTAYGERIRIAHQVDGRMHLWPSACSRLRAVLRPTVYPRIWYVFMQTDDLEPNFG